MGYINFQLQNNSFSIIFQAREEEKGEGKKSTLLFVLFISYWKDKTHFK